MSSFRKLELLSEISGLKLRHATLEKENIDLRRQLQAQQHLIMRDSQASQRKSYGGTEMGKGVRYAR